MLLNTMLDGAEEMGETAIKGQMRSRTRLASREPSAESLAQAGYPTS